MMDPQKNMFTIIWTVQLYAELYPYLVFHSLSDFETLPLVFRMSPRHKHTPIMKGKQSERLSLNGWNAINKCRGVMQRLRLD
jgi:hypothetical protein